jgi:osmotically-inducible protein OsmY
MRISQIPDPKITQQINQKLGSRGLRPPCHVTVQTADGVVTLSGTVQYAHQKGSAVQVATPIKGVRRVVDQLIVKPYVKR